MIIMYTVVLSWDLAVTLAVILAVVIAIGAIGHALDVLREVGDNDAKASRLRHYLNTRFPLPEPDRQSCSFPTPTPTQRQRPLMATTMADLAAAQSTDAATIATDTAAILADQAAVAAATAQQGTDTTVQTTDAAALSAALVVTGPVAIPSADGKFVSVYLATPGASPAYSVTTYPVASNVPIPVPAAGTPAA
jgi:hypothetical protein